MKRIDLKTGFSCNNNCLFCVQAHKKKFGNKNFDELASFMEESANEGFEGIVFTGGEPTIRPDIVDLVKLAKKLGFKSIQIQTNGRRFAYPDFCREMIDAGANEFSPALHGHIPALHDYLTRADGSFKQTVMGIMNLKKMGQLVLTNTVITKSNFRHLPQIAKLLVHLKVDQFQFAFVHAMGAAGENFNSVVPRKTMVAPFLKKALDVGITAGARVMAEAMPYCFLEGYERYIAEEMMPDTKIYDLDLVIEDFEKVRIDSGKSRGENCKKCVYFNRCEGPWREYPEKFGWNEFKPVF
jgi:MoaA/NifB/PqqE/SkfB family radical SAM enzyme